MTDETRETLNLLPGREGSGGGGRLNHMEVEGLTLGSYLQPGVGHRRVRRGENLINT